MKKISEQQLLSGLQSENNDYFKHLKNLCFGVIYDYVRKNKGTKQDAEDIFQESTIILLENVRKQNFSLTSSLKTYFYAIAKNIWLKKLRTDKKFDEKKDEITAEIQGQYENGGENNNFSFGNDNPTMEIEHSEKKIQHWLSKITQTCQYVLNAIFFLKIDLKNLMEKMGWKNKHTASTQKYKCIAQMKKQQQKEHKENTKKLEKKKR